MRYWRIFLLSLLLCVQASMLQARNALNDSLQRQVKILPDDTGKVLVLRELAFEYLGLSPDTALILAEEMIRISEKKHFSKGLAMAYDVEGNVFRTKGEYNKAVNKHLDALRIFDSLHETKRYRSVLVNTGTDHFFLKNYNQALEYYEQALELTDKEEVQRYVTIINNMGNVYTFQQKHREAIAIYQKALPLAEADSTYQMQPSLYSSMAISYAQLGEWKKAIDYMRKAIVMHQYIGDRYLYASSSSTLAGFYIELSEYALAEKYLETAFQTASEIGAKSVIANYYRNKAHLYHRMGRHNEAYNWLNRYTELNDSLISESHVEELADSEARFNVEMQRRELALANADTALKKSELNRQYMWTVFFILLLLVVALLLFFVYRNMQLKKKANVHLEMENTMLQKENILAQYETLRNQVNPHFLFNSLNALSSLIRNDAQKAIEFTAVFSRLYRQVLELKGHSVITLAEELQLADDYVYLQKIRFGNNLVLTKNINAAFMDCVLPPFCLQMLIENAIKHNVVSNESPLEISIYTENHFLAVSNNLQTRSQNESTGVGIKNITERFRLIHDTQPSFFVSDNTYIAKVPLIHPM